MERENVNTEIGESGDEIFNETKQIIQFEEFLRLSEIEDFHELEESKLYSTP